MNKQRLAVISVILLVFFLLAVSVYYLVKKKSERKSFPDDLVSLERVLEKDSSPYNSSIIRSFYTRKLTGTELKQVSKRIYDYCKVNNDYTLLEGVLKKHVRKHDDDGEIASLYLFSLIRNGKYKTAFEFSKGRKYGSIFDSLKLQAFILSNNDPAEADLISPDEKDLADSLSQRNGTDYEYLASVSGDAGFALDAALLFLSSGNPEKAYSILKDVSPDFKNRNILLFSSAMKSGKFEQAMDLLDSYDLGYSAADMKLYRADIYSALRQYGRSLRLYLDFLELYPDYSWIPYSNLAWLAVREKNTTLSPVLIRGADNFSAEDGFSSNLIDYLVFSGHKEEAVKYIDRYCSDNPVFKLAAYGFKGRLEPELAIARIQELLLQNPEDRQIRQYYCWFLFESGNIPLLEDYLSRRKSEGELAPWEKVFEAAILASKSMYGEAEDMLKEAYDVYGYWEILFDMGRIYHLEGNFLKAVEFFQKAENSIPGGDAVKRSFVRSELAQVLYDSGSMTRAVKEAEYALRLDKNNIKAFLILEKLESESN